MVLYYVTYCKRITNSTTRRRLFRPRRVEGKFCSNYAKEEVDKILDTIEVDIDDIKDLSEFHTVAGFIKTNSHYFEFLHYNNPNYPQVSGYLILDFQLVDGVWLEVGKHHFCQDYEDLYGREYLLRAKLMESVFNLPSFVD